MLKKNKKNPVISVIIPVYNEAKYITKCINSLKQQTLNNFEIIVVNDGSTDLTKEIVTKSNVKLFSISHSGPGNAKNFGAINAVGKILVFIDGDMFVKRDYLQKIIGPIINRKTISTYSTAEYVANSEKIWSRCWNINFGLSSRNRIMKNDQTLGMAFRAILRDEFLKTKGYDPRLGYIDDRSLAKYKIISSPVNNAECYHYNPETLSEVFFSARWIGRSPEFKQDFQNIVRYSFINSIRLGIKKIINGAPFRFLLFKLIFDLGISVGILFKNAHYNYSK